MAQAASPEAIAASQAFFTRHDSYGPFDLTRDNKMIIGCIEPRDQENTPHGEYKTIMQTPGGAPGEGLDAALALTIKNDELTPIEDGMDTDCDSRPVTVFGAHHDCAFIANLVPVVEEMSDPSDFTVESVEKWSRYFNDGDHVAATLGKVSTAAARMAEYLNENGHMDDLVDHADELYPEHSNVVHVKGPAGAYVYVTGLHPHIGKNRNMKPTDPEEAMNVRAYHDSLAATIDNLRGANKLEPEIRGLRATAMLLRSAAARTVITRGKLDKMTLLEVAPANTRNGIKITEQK